MNRETLGRFLLRGLRIGASTVAIVELLRNDWSGDLSAGVAWLVVLQVERQQGHQPGLLHRPTRAADVDRDTGLRESLTRAGVDVHDHLADRAAGGGGSHAWMARNTDPAPRRRAAPGRRRRLRQPWHGRGGERMAG